MDYKKTPISKKNNPGLVLFLFDLKIFVKCSSRIRFAMAKCEQVPFCAFGLITDFLRESATPWQNVSKLPFAHLA